MKCIICSNKISPDPDGWDGGHNAEPIAKGKCCGDCNAIVTVRRLNDFQDRRNKNGFFRITGETEKPVPNHCVECDTPIMDIIWKICDECKKKEDNTKICGGCGEADCNGSCITPIDEEPMSNCCNAHFTYPGFPDSDLCSKCFEHADIDEDDSWDNNPDDGSWKGR